MTRTPRRSWADLQLDAISSCNDAAIDLTELASRMLDKRNKTWVDKPLLAELLGVARRTVCRWQAEGRLPFVLWRHEIERRAHLLRPRRRGPPARRSSVRYNAGRHRWPYGDRRVSK